MQCDQMTSQERWDALINRETLDRVPCLQFMLGHTAVVNGKPIAKVYDDAAESLACQRNAMALYGHDGLIMHGWANAGGAEFGGRHRVPLPQVHRRPMMKKNPVQNEDDAWKLRVPGRHHHRRHHPGGARVLPPAVRGGHAGDRAGGLAPHLGRARCAAKSG